MVSLLGSRIRSPLGVGTGVVLLASCGKNSWAFMLAVMDCELVASSLVEAGAFPTKAPSGDVIKVGGVSPSVGTGWPACTLLFSENWTRVRSLEFVGKTATT